MDAPDVERSAVLPGGLEYDRGWAVVGGQDVLSARAAPQLREVCATPPAGSQDGPTLLLPGAPHEVTGPEADAALSRLLGREVAVRRAGTGEGFAEVAPVHLVSRQAVERAAGDEGTVLGDPACSVEQPRANVVLELDVDDLETTWVGREVHVGDVLLRVSQLPQHCLGVYADVVRPGAVGIGDEVRLA